MVDGSRATDPLTPAAPRDRPARGHAGRAGLSSTCSARRSARALRSGAIDRLLDRRLDRHAYALRHRAVGAELGARAQRLHHAVPVPGSGRPDAVEHGGDPQHRLAGRSRPRSGGAAGRPLGRGEACSPTFDPRPAAPSRRPPSIIPTSPRPASAGRSSTPRRGRSSSASPTRVGFLDMMRAVYEGLGFAARDCYEAMGHAPDEIRVAGGAARSAGHAADPGRRARPAGARQSPRGGRRRRCRDDGRGRLGVFPDVGRGLRPLGRRRCSASASLPDPALARALRPSSFPIYRDSRRRDAADLGRARGGPPRSSA